VLGKLRGRESDNGEKGAGDLERRREVFTIFLKEEKPDEETSVLGGGGKSSRGEEKERRKDLEGTSLIEWERGKVQ